MKNNVLKLPPVPPKAGGSRKNRAQKYVVGNTLVCTAAATQFYTKGKTYEVEEVEGKFGVRGSDGLFDPFTDLISTFEVV